LLAASNSGKQKGVSHHGPVYCNQLGVRLHSFAWPSDGSKVASSDAAGLAHMWPTE